MALGASGSDLMRFGGWPGLLLLGIGIAIALPERCLNPFPRKLLYGIRPPTRLRFAAVW